MIGKPKTATSAVNEIARRFGMKTIATEEQYAIQAVNTGSMCLNAAIGVGGYPSGSLIEVFGDPNSGKTTLSLIAIAQEQRAGNKCVYIDAEKKFDPSYARKLGVNMDELILINALTGEEGLEIVCILAETDDVGLIVVDSVAALVPEIDLITQVGDALAGVQARMMSDALKKLIKLVHRNKAAVIFTNQVRYKLGDHESAPVTKTTPGGNALKHYARVRIELVEGGVIQNNLNEVEGAIIGARIHKNDVGKRGATVPIYLLNYGVSYDNDLIDLGLRYNVIENVINTEGENEETLFVMGGNVLSNERTQAMKVLVSNEQAKAFLFKALEGQGVVFKPAKEQSQPQCLLLEHEGNAA